MSGFQVPSVGNIAVSNGRPPTPVVPLDRVHPEYLSIAAALRAAADQIEKSRPASEDALEIIDKCLDCVRERRITGREILHEVSRVTGVAVSAIESPHRDAETTKARHTAAWLMRRCTRLSMPEIGRKLGKRDHTTVLHAIRRVDRVVGSLLADLPPETPPAVLAGLLWEMDWQL